MKEFHAGPIFQMLLNELTDIEKREVLSIDSYTLAVARVVEIKQAKQKRRIANEIYPHTSNTYSPKIIRHFET
jgi:hypothetical protein